MAFIFIEEDVKRLQTVLTGSIRIRTVWYYF